MLCKSVRLQNLSLYKQCAAIKLILLENYVNVGVFPNDLRGSLLSRQCRRHRQNCTDFLFAHRIFLGNRISHQIFRPKKQWSTQNLGMNLQLFFLRVFSVNHFLMTRIIDWNPTLAILYHVFLFHTSISPKSRPRWNPFVVRQGIDRVTTVELFRHLSFFQNNDLFTFSVNTINTLFAWNTFCSHLVYEEK